MQKFTPALLLLPVSLLIAACGGNAIDKAEKVDQRELAVKSQVCPPGQYDDGMLKCKTKTQATHLSIPVPAGWSAYRFGWDNREDVNGASQTGVASMTQDQAPDNCHLVVSVIVDGFSRKPINQKRIQEHNSRSSKQAAWHLGDKLLPGGSGWFWIDVAGTPGIFAATPQGDGTFLSWRLLSQPILFKDGKPSAQECTVKMSQQEMLDVLTKSASGAKLTR